MLLVECGKNIHAASATHILIHLFYVACKITAREIINFQIWETNKHKKSKSSNEIHKLANIVQRVQDKTIAKYMWFGYILKWRFQLDFSAVVASKNIINLVSLSFIVNESKPSLHVLVDVSEIDICEFLRSGLELVSWRVELRKHFVTFILSVSPRSYGKVEPNCEETLHDAYSECTSSRDLLAYL